MTDSQVGQGDYGESVRLIRWQQELCVAFTSLCSVVGEHFYIHIHGLMLDFHHEILIKKVCTGILTDLPEGLRRRHATASCACLSSYRW